MTVQDIINYASSRLLGKSVNSSDAIDWINDALNEMGVDARKTTTSQIVAQESETWYNLPSGCLSIDEVQASDGHRYSFWHTDGNRIMFMDADTYTIRYFVMPSKVVNATDIPDCPEVYHQALAYYVAYRFDARDFPGANLSMARLNEYRSRYAQAKSSLPKRERYIRVWRWS